MKYLGRHGRIGPRRCKKCGRLAPYHVLKCPLDSELLTWEL